MAHPHLTLVPAVKVKHSAVTAVRRAFFQARPVDVERVWEADELGAILLGEDERAPIELTRRARSRSTRSRFAPPVWRQPRRHFEALLSTATPFDTLPASLIAELGQVAQWVSVAPGGSLFAEGDRLEHTFVVAQGRFDVRRREAAELGNAGSGSALGLCSALGAEGATATVTSRLGGSALRLPNALVADLAMSDPDFRAELVRLGDLRRFCHLLSASPFADLCGAAGRAGIAAMFRRRYLSIGEALVREGEVVNGFALVEAGRLALWMRAGAGLGERPMALAGPGQALGVVSSLRGQPCLGSLRAIEPTELSVLDHDALRTLLLWNPSLRGLPALLASRGQLVSGSFFSATGALPAAKPGWLELQAPTANQFLQAPRERRVTRAA
jgi:CRP-like cAMP-binding protein